MSGFFAPQADWWRRTRERIPLPFAREDAMIDLRWWQDQVLIGRERRIPTHRELGDAWGWGEKKARLLLEREEEWGDPDKASAWKKHRGHTGGTPGARAGHTEGTTGQGSPETVGPEGHTGGTRRAHRGHKKGDAGVVYSPTPTPTPTPQPSAPPPAASVESSHALASIPIAEMKPPAEPKAKRFDMAWVRLMTDRWARAWGPEKYRFDMMKDRETLARCAAALDVERNQPLPPAVLDHLERAMGVYIAAARRDDPKCFPRGVPTVGGFVQRLSEWLHCTETTTVSFADVPKATVEARMRRELDAGSTVTELRERLKVTTKMKPPEIAYALTFLDRLEAR